MKRFFACLYAAAALLLAAPVVAQPALPAATYTGPRYPGGPDSLRALVCRGVRSAGPAPTGRVLLQFELTKEGKPGSLKLVRPPDPVNKDLLRAGAKAVDYLRARMSNWQPGTPDPDAKAPDLPLVALMLDFGADPPASNPYDYADENPSFLAIPRLLREQHNKYIDRQLDEPAGETKFAFSPKGLIAYLQLQTRYPSEALRGHQQGTVYAYFEVAESGAIEHVAVAGTAGQALDAEVLRALQRLPAASAPARLRGQPVRVRYALPITFKIM